MSDSSNSTSQGWDQASKGYADKVAPKLMEPFTGEMIDLLQIEPYGKAIEVACGSGILTVPLARKVDSLLATDFSSEMIKLAKESVEDAGMLNVRFEVMDGQALEVADNSMNYAASSFGIMLFEDRIQGFRELNRVLMPEGRAVVSAWAGPDRFEAFGLFLRALSTAFPDLPKPESPPPVFSLSDLEVFKEEFEKGGFEDVAVGFVDRTVTIDGLDEVWEMMTSGAPPVKEFIDKVGQEGKVKLYESLERVLFSEFGEGPISLTNTATIGVGKAT